MSGPHYEQRRNKLRKRFRDAGVDALLISGVSNVRYLTGFTGDSSWLYLSAKDAVVLSDTRFETQLADQCPDLQCEIRDAASTIGDLARKVAAAARSKRIGIESDHLTLNQFHVLQGTLTSVELVPTSGLIERLREVKDKWELEQIRKAVEIAERGIAVVRSCLTKDQTEVEIRNLLEASMRSFGASGPAFEPIVGVGPTAALPRAHAGHHKVHESSLLLVDWGATTESGYRSDLTRVFFTGKPTRQMEQVYRIVLQAQQEAIRAIKPGVECIDVDRIARGIIADAGFGSYFGHGLGHGFGLDVHESVRVSPLSKQRFEPGMVVTVEPGIYLPGRFGIRIEDDILVTADGNEVLSGVPREFDDAFVPFLA